MVSGGVALLRLPGVRGVADLGAFALDGKALRVVVDAQLVEDREEQVTSQRLRNTFVELAGALEEVDEGEHLFGTELHAVFSARWFLCDSRFLQRDQVQPLADLGDRQLPFRGEVDEPHFLFFMRLLLRPEGSAGTSIGRLELVKRARTSSRMPGIVAEVNCSRRTALSTAFSASSTRRSPRVQPVRCLEEQTKYS